MTNVNAKTLNAIIVAFRAEMKAAKKTAEAIDAFAVECMDAGIKRADAAKALRRFGLNSGQNKHNSGCINILAGILLTITQCARRAHSTRHNVMVFVLT